VRGEFTAKSSGWEKTGFSSRATSSRSQSRRPLAAHAAARPRPAAELLLSQPSRGGSRPGPACGSSGSQCSRRGAVVGESRPTARQASSARAASDARASSGATAAPHPSYAPCVISTDQRSMARSKKRSVAFTRRRKARHSAALPPAGGSLGNSESAPGTHLLQRLFDRREWMIPVLRTLSAACAILPK
jgi:hypothetical protein